MLPVTLGLGLINLNLLVNTCFAARVDHDLGPAAVDKAFRIYMLPQGMFSVAVAAVLFPALSRRAAARDGPGFRALVGSGLRQIAFLLIPAAAHLRRARDADRAPALRARQLHARRTPTVVASCLAAFSLGLAFNGAMLLLNRAFFSMQRAWVPTTIAIANLAVNATLDYVLSSTASASGASRSPPRSRTSSASRSSTSSCARSPAGSTSASSCARSCASSWRPCSRRRAAYGVWRVLDSLLGQFVPFQVLSLGVGLAASVVVYMLAAQAMKIEELDDVLALLRRRRSKPAPA